MGISLTLPLIVLLALTLAACGLIMGAVVAPCRLSTRRRAAMGWNIVGFILFVGSLVSLFDFVNPHHPEAELRAWQAFTNALWLTGVFVATEAMVLLLRWGWKSLRGKPSSPRA